MNKKILPSVLIGLFLLATAFVVVKYRVGVKTRTAVVYHLKERSGPQAKLPEWAFVKKSEAELQERWRREPNEPKHALELANLYLQEARITGDYAYYDAAALSHINNVLEADPNHTEALVLKSVLELSHHHFAEGLETAKKVQQANPHFALAYGLLVDGSVEMGDYASAIDYADRMCSIRPDIRSYARISYLREIHGDYPGAIEAMQAAMESGSEGDEPTSWARVQLARLHLLSGDLATAEMHYALALERRPGFAHALDGLAQVAMAKKDYKNAEALLQQARTALADPSFTQHLARCYQLSGQADKAKDLYQATVHELSKQAGEGDPATAHHADLELAEACLMTGEAKKAVVHAETEYRRRPENIDVNEVLAWAYDRADRKEEALRHIQKALRTGSRNPVLLTRAGIIYSRNGQADKGRAMIQQGLQHPWNLEPGLRAEAEQMVKGK